MFYKIPLAYLSNSKCYGPLYSYLRRKLKLACTHTSHGYTPLTTDPLACARTALSNQQDQFVPAAQLLSHTRILGFIL